MFKIDLLKGEGVPIKSGPEGIAIIAATAAVPLIIAIGMVGVYWSNGINISIQKQDLNNYETKIGKLSEAVELQESFEKEKSVITSSLSEVSSSLRRFVQWTPVLVTLVENMPESIVLDSLKVKTRTTKIKVPDKDNPEIMIDKTVPAKTLLVGVNGSLQSDSDKAVKDFSDSLRSSTLLGPKLEDIRISQKVDAIKNVVSYQIKCIFKPQL